MKITLKNEHRGRFGKLDAGEYDLDDCNPAVAAAFEAAPGLFQIPRATKKALSDKVALETETAANASEVEIR